MPQAALRDQKMLDARPVLELAGYALCHGIWTVHAGKPLPPAMLVGGRQGRALTTVPADNPGDALLIARGNVESLGHAFRQSAIIFDGTVTDGGARIDAVVIEARIGGRPEVVTVLQRYRPVDHPAGFAILGRPLFAVVTLPEFRTRAEGFVDRGIGQHPAAGELWSTWWEPDVQERRRTA